MAILNVNSSPATADIVAILNEQGQQVFERCRPLKATGTPEIKYMTHPQETGGNTTDHFIILPDIVSVSCIVQTEDYRSVFQAIEQAARAAQPLIVQTKSKTYTNMRIASYPSEEDPSTFDTIGIELVFREIQTDTAQVQTLPPAAVANPGDASTVNRGQQQAPAAQENDQTLAQRIFS